MSRTNLLSHLKLLPQRARDHAALAVHHDAAARAQLHPHLERGTFSRAQPGCVDHLLEPSLCSLRLAIGQNDSNDRGEGAPVPLLYYQ